MLTCIDRFNMREEFRHLGPAPDLEEAVEEEEVLSGDDTNEHCISDDDEGSATEDEMDSSLPRVPRNESRPCGLSQRMEMLRKKKAKDKGKRRAR